MLTIAPLVPCVVCSYTRCRMELFERIAAHARHRGSAIAIRQADAERPTFCTYALLHERVNTLASRLGEILPRGSVVMLLCSNRPDFWVCYFAALAAELSIFPLTADIAPAELKTAATRSDASAVLAETRLINGIRGVFFHEVQLAELGDEMRLVKRTGEHELQPGAGLLLQSSGTTGHAKIVWRSAASLDHMAKSMCERIGFEPHDGVLTGMPLSHSYGGEHGVLAPAFGGASVHVCSGVQLPVIARELNESAITMLPGVPFLYEIMSQASESIPKLNHLRHTFSAGAQLPAVVYEAFTRRYGIPIGQIYGATEIGSVTFNDPDREGFHPQSAGLPLDGVEIRILDQKTNQPLKEGEEGQVVVKTPTMLSHVVEGKTNSRHEDQFVDGFVVTGDLGRLDSYGALTITGRLRLLIDVGGRKVNPIEVEQVMREHPLVAECVVVPVMVSHTVSRLKAVVVPSGAATPEAAEMIRTFARERLTAYKVPRMIEFRESLPKTPLGKILRHLVEGQA